MEGRASLVNANSHVLNFGGTWREQFSGRVDRTNVLEICKARQVPRYDVRTRRSSFPSSEPKRPEGEVPRSIRLAIRGVVGIRLWSPSASDCPLLG